MPLIQCPNCKRDIANTCEKCSYCGFQIKSLLIDSEDDIRAHYLLIGSRILFVVLILAVLVGIVVGIKNSTRESIEKAKRKSIENAERLNNSVSLKPEIPNPDTLLAQAKSLYKEGRYNAADIVVTQIIKNYKNSTVAIEASKLKVTVVKAIQDKWKSDQRKREVKDRMEENKRQQELQRIYDKDPIRYYKNIYGDPNSEDDFSYESYITKTLIWYCVDGKYRSITFEYKYGTWRKQSEYKSNCL